MADDIKKVKIKDLPQTISISDDDIFVESDTIETYKVTADDIAIYISENEHMTNTYIQSGSKGVANGVAPLNSNKKIDGKYITYGTTSNTAYEGSNGKILETNLDNHLTDEDAHGYNTKINDEVNRAKNAELKMTSDLNSEISRAKSAESTLTTNLNAEITRAKDAESTLSVNKLDKTTVAKSNELGLIKSGTDITVDASGNVSVNDNSHKHTVSNISDLTATASELNVLDGITATTTELNYTDGVTSNIQTQLNSKSANGHTHDDRYYTESEIDSKISDVNSSISSHTGNKSNPHSVTKAQIGLGNVENKSSATIRGEITKNNVTTALGYTPYTPNEVDNKFATLETNIDWKESVATYDDIATTYPTPVDGWTVNVKDTDYTYRYNGTSWVAISANAIPKATNSVDGLLSKEDHANYEDANSKKHTHSNKSVIDGISSTNVSNWNSAKTHADSTHARTDATKVEKSSTNGNIKINGTETTVYTHPSGTNPHGTTKSDVGLGNVGNFKAVSTVANQGLTDAEKANARANIGAGTSSFSGSYNDLTNKPTIPTNNNQLTNGAGYITSLGTAKTISDTLPISKGGTGQTTGINAANTLINSLSTGESTPTDADYYISQYVGGGTTTTTYHRRPMSALWNYIKSKLATVATSGSYNDLSNKPTIPSVGNGTVTIKQAGTSKGTFTMNQSGNTTIELTDNNTTYSSKSAASGGTDVSLVTTGEKYIWNSKTSSTGTITGINMNGSSKGTSGVVDLGTVLTGGSQTTTSSADGGSNVYTFSDGSTITVKNGSKGSKGDSGANGTNGTSVTVSSTSVTYQAGSSGTTAPTGTWSTSVPSVSNGQYLWSKTVVTYSDGKSTTTYNVGYKGTNGSNGTNGTNGTSAGFGTPTASVDANVGTPSVTITASGSNTAKVFNFAFKNLKGQPGTNGKNGTNGTNGTSAAWFTGTAVTGTDTSGISASVSGSKANDMYLNTSTYNVYKATAANTWGYVCNIKGKDGTNGTNATTTSVVSTSANGLAPKVTDTSKFLKGDGTWATPLSIGTTATTAAAGNHTHSAYVNQNAFSNVTVGSTTVSADSATDTLTLVAGSNITITPDATNDKITIAATDTNTKNTAGSTDTSSKIFLIGATSQAANPQTYSHDTVYVGTDGCLYSNSTRVVSEVVSSTEPTNQKNGDYWLQDY